MKITYRVAMEIAAHEAIVRQTYYDSVGVPTWSVGLTSATGHDVKRYLGKPQSLEHCLGVFVWALDNYAEAVRAEFASTPLSEEEFGGALSFHWNTGAIRSASWPDLWKAGKVAEARASFLSWKKPPEILKRRQKEAALFFDGVWSATSLMTEYGVTSKNTPDWSSAHLIDVSDILHGLLDQTPPPPVVALGPAESKLARIAAILAEP